ncbi:uncharacterized protein N0V89_009353 [Didymosphaeria variabile]|uniref:Uncharacterized protein n=1 Tax=Didymosphaeria variabile TaxID=1932322 RepID=A0A9W9C773_9PLEO|nr:uncharacterized protein N0V89_009353 [Didymosphaeria variabile]KAJ4347981.1 hypothetical protein N0V89_009353 [Didymosphaeria variabile]
MPQPTLPDRIWSVFSIIRLGFKAPFTERGPPEFLYDLFKDCLNQLEKEERPEWIMWGNETTDPDRSPDRNEPVLCGSYPWYERHCDFFTVEAPSDGPLDDSIEAEMTKLRQNCISLLPDILCGKDRPHGDIKEVTLGMDAYQEKVDPDLGHHVNDFVLLVYWSNQEAMARFKHPELESIAQYGKKIETDWWRQEVDAEVRQKRM